MKSWEIRLLIHQIREAIIDAHFDGRRGRVKELKLAKRKLHKKLNEFYNTQNIP